MGDDAIARGMSRVYGNALVLISEHACPQLGPTMTMQRAFEAMGPDDTFLLGGGGLLFSEEVIRDHLIPSASKAKAAGARVEMRGVGCDGEGRHARELVRELCGHLDFIGVRSRWSREHLRTLGFDAALEPDFALCLDPPPPAPRDIPVLFIPRTDGALTLADIGAQLQVLAEAESRVVCLTHVPEHSLSSKLSEWEPLQQTISGLKDDRIELRRASTVADALSLYASARRVVTMRYHGLVFAHLTGTPAAPLPPDDLKLRSFRS